MAGVFKTVLEVSITAGVISLMALGARLLMGRRPGALLPLLTALIIVRLAIPLSIPSPLSIQNLLPRIELPAGAENVSLQEDLPDLSGTEALQAGTAEDTSTGADLTEQATVPAAPDSEQATAPIKRAETAAALQAMDICTLVWIFGIAALAAFVTAGNARFAGRIRRNRKYDSPGFNELLFRCRTEMGLRRNVEAVQMSEINTAAVYGTFRPKLLISPSFGWLSEEEKRHVLLHELAHIKRGDTLFSLLITALNIVYWFNPLVWAALALARRDIEVMCDMAVLRKTEDRKGYAKTLLDLAKAAHANRPRMAAALFVSPQRFGVLVSTNSIKRRITMIARYKKSPGFTALALVLALAIAVTGCTGAVLPSATGAGDVSAQGGSELVAQYSLDISELPKDEARQENIEKAAAMLDGTVFPATGTQGEWVDLKSKLGGITEEAGWRKAPAAGYGFLGKALGMTITYSRVDNGESRTLTPEELDDLDTNQTVVGGGTELVTFAVLKAASDLGMDTVYIMPETELADTQSDTVYICSSFGSSDIDKDIEGYTKGRTGVLNRTYPQDVFVKIEASEERITASLYNVPKADKAAAAAPKLEGQELIASYSLDFSSIAGDEARVANIKKVARILDGTVLEHWDGTLPAAEDCNRQIDILGALGPISEQAGWETAPWVGWQSAGTYLFEDSRNSGSYRENYGNPPDTVKMPGGGLEIASMAVYRAAQLAEMDVSMSYAVYSEEEWQKCAYPAVKVLTNGEAVFSDFEYSGGVGVANNIYASDITLKTWVQDNNFIAAFYAEGSAELIPRTAWQQALVEAGIE